MDKRLLIVATIFVLTPVTLLIQKNSGSQSRAKTNADLLPRETSFIYASEWEMTKNNATTYLAKLEKNPNDRKSMLGLTAIYLQEARITGNFDYYHEAAMVQLDKVLGKDPDNFEALTFKATILLSQHRFEQAKDIATEVLKQYPHNAYVYGLLVDADIELGNYEGALESAEKMISIRPDHRSYSRIAYLREIFGDIPGAIEAMNMAVEAGNPGDENTEWCRVQLAKLHEQCGNINEAKQLYETCLSFRANYPYALAGLAGIAVYKQDYRSALGLYLKADSMINDHLVQEGKAEVYSLLNEKEKEKNTRKRILNRLKKYENNSDKIFGQNEDHELAHAYLALENYSAALKYATREYSRRPANIEVNETMALIHYEMKNYTQALPYLKNALSTNSNNPQLSSLAGLVYHKIGDTANAAHYLRKATLRNPVMDVEISREVNEILSTLN